MSSICIRDNALSKHGGVASLCICGLIVGVAFHSVHLGVVSSFSLHLHFMHLGLLQLHSYLSMFRLVEKKFKTKSSNDDF